MKKRIGKNQMKEQWSLVRNWERIARRWQHTRSFARQVVKNHLDRRSVKITAIDFTRVQDEEFDGNVKKDVVLSEVSTYGMNMYTRKVYEDEVSGMKQHIAVHNGALRTMSNVILDEEVKQPHTDEFISIRLPELMDKQLAASLLEATAANTVTLQFCQEKQMAYIWFESENKCGEKMYRCYDILGKGISIYYVDGDESLEDDDNRRARAAANKIRNTKGSVFKKYGFIYAGPSNQRQVNCFAFKVHDGESHEEFLIRMAEQFNELTGGLYDTLKEMVEAAKKKGKPIQYKKLYKLVSRISLAFTPMTPTFGADCFAYYHGSFGNTGLSDGQWIVDSGLIADYFGLEEEGVYGLGLQARVTTGIIGKGMSIPMGRDEIGIILGEYNNLHFVEYDLFRELYINGKLEEEAMYIVYLKGEEVSYDYRPAFVFDENTMKAVGTRPESFVYSILEVRNNTRGKLNTQDLSCMQHLEGCEELVLEAGKKYILEEAAKIEAIIRGKVSDTFTPPDAYYPQLIVGLCPAYVSHDSSLYSSSVNAMIEGMVNKIHDMKYPLNEGDQYRYLQNDYANMFSCKNLKVLLPGETFVPGVRAGRKCILTRNPKADAKEFYSAKTVSLYTIRKRTQALNCSKILKIIIWTAYLHADDSLIITPADKRVANTLGGSDFDGDGSTIHFTRKFVSVQLQESDGMSIIPGPKKENKPVRVFNAEVLQGFMIDGLFGRKNEKGQRMTPVSVGVNSNHAATIRALRMLSDKELKNVIDNVIRPNVKNLLNIDEFGTEPYVCRYNMPNVEIGDADVVAATNDYYHSDLTLRSTRNFLDDSMRMSSSVIGRGIDQNKNGDDVHPGYLGVISGTDVNGERIRAKDLVTVKLLDHLNFKPVSQCLTECEDGTKKFEIDWDYSSVFGKKKMIIKSKLTYVTEKLMKFASKIITALLNHKCVEPASVYEFVSGSKKEQFKTYYNEADLRMASRIHGHLVGNDGLISKEKELMKRAVSNMVRMSFKEGTAEAVKFFAIKRQAVRDSEKEGGDINYSSFEHILKEEFVRGVLWAAEKEGYATNKKLGWPVILKDARVFNKEENYQATFVNGYDKEHGVVSKNKHLNGTYSVIKEGGSWYAIVTLEEYYNTASCGKEVVFMLRDYNESKARREREEIALGLSNDMDRYNVLPNLNGFKCAANSSAKVGKFKVHKLDDGNAFFTIEDALNKSKRGRAEIKIDDGAHVKHFPTKKWVDNGHGKKEEVDTTGHEFTGMTSLLKNIDKKNMVLDSTFQWRSTRWNEESQENELFIKSAVVCRMVDDISVFKESVKKADVIDVAASVKSVEKTTASFADTAAADDFMDSLM